MSLFRRRREADQTPEGEGAVGTSPGHDADTGDSEAPEQTAGALPGARDGGPFDETEVHDDVQRLDLGALRVPARPGMELRLETESATQRVVAATIGLSGSTMQLQAFAAPRTEGIWDDIRIEIAEQVRRQGGSAEEVAGSFGRELLARLPVRTPEGRTGHRPARFVGVDGPRWFLRGVFGGPAAAGADAAAELEGLLRGTVVVRGGEAMAPRDLLALKLPAGAQGGAAAQPTQDGGSGSAPSSPAPMPPGS